MDLSGWVRDRGGIAHRSDVLERGVTARDLRASIARGEVQRLRRYWVAVAGAPLDLVAAARATGRVACVSAARHRGWWMPPDCDERLHLHVVPHGQAHPPAPGAVLHWTDPLTPAGARVLVESVEDSLQHIADCLPREQALVLWEDAARAERIAPESLRRIRWRSARARELAEVLTGLMGSGLETIFVSRLRPWGIPIRVQVPLAGHDVDVLIGDRLVVQLDGFAHHSSSADRTRDLAHDRELTARGFTVLRFSYVELLYRWEQVERAIARAIAQGLHRAA